MGGSAGLTVPAADNGRFPSMKKLLPVLCSAALGMASPASAALASISGFSFTSSPSAYVGAGESRTIFEGDPGLYFNMGMGTSTIFNLYAGTSDSPIVPNWTPGDPDSHYYRIHLQAPLGQLLGTGTYTSVTFPMYVNHDQAGLAFWIDDRSPVAPLGQFTVLEAVYDNSGNTVSFAADFIQYDMLDTTQWNIGSVRWRSSVPLTIPEPQPAVLALLALGVCHRRGRRSFQFPVGSFQSPDT
ncbi:MAG: hypothetical protein JWM59_256 [Verrucomicrobiales bacterium]|nr:hypothetical protein [Verrucomicrobiales bacterium]